MKLGVGTAQFGCDYGISNVHGRASSEHVREILDVAVHCHVKYLDTAPIYGNSEALIGDSLPSPNPFSVVTKTPRLLGRQITAVEEEAVSAALHESLRRLRQTQVYGLLVHNTEDLFAPGGARVYNRMRRLKSEGLVLKIGVSVYTAEQIDRVLDSFDIDLVQLPISVFDQRLIVSGRLASLNRRGIEVHARSIFLQGVLLMDPDALPPFFEPVRNHIRMYRRSLAEQGMTPLAAALRFATSLPEVDAVICGVARASELREIRAALSGSEPLPEFSKYAIDNPTILMPSTWLV